MRHDENNIIIFNHARRYVATKKEISPTNHGSILLFIFLDRHLWQLEKRKQNNKMIDSLSIRGNEEMRSSPSVYTSRSPSLTAGEKKTCKWFKWTTPCRSGAMKKSEVVLLSTSILLDRHLWQLERRKQEKFTSYSAGEPAVTSGYSVRLQSEKCIATTCAYACCLQIM